MDVSAENGRVGQDRSLRNFRLTLRSRPWSRRLGTAESDRERNDNFRAMGSVELREHDFPGQDNDTR